MQATLFENLPDDRWPTFNDFWEAYQYKVGKELARKKWLKLRHTEKVAAMTFIPQYVKCTPEKKYRLHPTTFLNQKAWHDEDRIEKVSAGDQDWKAQFLENLREIS